MKENKKEKIDEILERGVEAIFPSQAYLRSKLESNEIQTIYFGIDPTGPNLHIGHAIPLKKLGQFQKLGHKIIILIGDFTAMIGDPTDKISARKQLTAKEVKANFKNYTKQISKIIDLKGKNKAIVKYNSKWLSKMNFEDVLNLAAKMTVAQMLERDMFKKRMEEGKPIHIHEFLYPLMQGYDSVAMKVDGEIGGNDQTFNMLAGRNLEKEILGKEKFVITTKLLTDTTGKKMGKSENNMLTVADNANEMFGKVMSWTDDMIISGFELCTNVPIDEIQKFKKELDGGANPKDLKVLLAKEIISIYHSKKDADDAENNFINTFSKGAIPKDVLEIKISKEDSLMEVLVKNKVVASNGEFRRLVEEGAVTNIENGEKVIDVKHSPKKDEVYRIGKKRFVKFV